MFWGLDISHCLQLGDGRETKFGSLTSLIYGRASIGGRPPNFLCDHLSLHGGEKVEEK